MRPAGRVWVVDNEPDSRTRIIQELDGAGFDVRGFESAEAFLLQRPLPTPSCVVVDQCLPGMCGLEVQQCLTDQSAVSVVFVTASQDIPTVVQAMKRGAVDFLTKPADQLALVAAVTRGIERSARAAAERHTRDRFVARLMRLTPREYQVIAGVIRGLLNKQIAWELGTAEKTVKVHRSRAMEKLEVESVAELARIAAATQTIVPSVSAPMEVEPAADRGPSAEPSLDRLNSSVRDPWHEF